jgi:hypothetical protein
MPKSRCLIRACAIALLPAAAPRAQADPESSAGETRLGRFLAAPAAGAQFLGAGTNIGVHAGYMFLPRGAADLGADISFPAYTVGDGWIPRIDVSALIGADLDGDNTAVSLTLNLVKTFVDLIEGRTIYFGGGVGWMFGGDGSFQAKLLAGTPITERVSLELNTHFIEGTVAWSVLARLQL